MENHTFDSSPEISKVNWVLNFLQASYRSDGFNKRNCLFIFILCAFFDLFFFIWYFFTRWNKKIAECLLPFWYSMCFLFARAYIGIVGILVISYQLTCSILVIYLFCFVTSRYKLCQNNWVFPSCSTIQYQIFRKHETSILFACKHIIGLLPDHNYFQFTCCVQKVNKARNGFWL